MIELINVTRRVAGMDRPLLSNISLSVEPSAKIGLVGPSGCGKSSLLRVIAMLDPVSEGRLHFDGKPIADADVPAYRRRVIYLPQRPAIVIATVRENLSAAFRMNSSTTEFDESQVMRWFSRLGKPASILDQTAEQLSGGERQLVAFVRALQLDPVVLLLDEPTASLDGESVSNVEMMLQEWLDEEKTRRLVWVSHDEAQVQRVTNRFMEMADGKLA